jgi:dinuclear metal center YbgI/SA1388 family protein
MQVRQITDYLEQIAPLHLQESYDNAGLLVGQHQAELEGVMVALDTTEEVIVEAKKRGCNLVIAHHPIIFGGIKRLNNQNYIERCIWRAIKEDVAIYATHTNLDNIKTGVNARIAQRLELQNCQILAPKKDVLHQNQPVGSGQIGQLVQAMPANDFLAHLKDKMQLRVIKHTPLCKPTITRVAVCGGAGGFLLKAAIAAEADVFITSDYKYHEFFDANDRIIICDIGHYESEIFTTELLAEWLRNDFPDLPIHITQTRTNPVSYYF